MAPMGRNSPQRTLGRVGPGCPASSPSSGMKGRMSLETVEKMTCADIMSSYGCFQVRNSLGRLVQGSMVSSAGERGFGEKGA